MSRVVIILYFLEYKMKPLFELAVRLVNDSGLELALKVFGDELRLDLGLNIKLELKMGSINSGSFHF